MTSLSSELSGQLLADPDLPEYHAHHAAKHGLLRNYANAWLPKLGYSYPKIAIVDGFASAGRYRDRRMGSPLLLLHAYLGRTDQARFQSPPHFVFIESVRKFARHLRAEVDAIQNLQGATVDVIYGKYEDEFPRVVDYVATQYRQPVPTFAFVDPRGYEDNPFDLLRSYRARLGAKAEAMVYVPISFMARFVATEITEQAMDRAFGSREAWDEVRRKAAPGVEAGARLAEAYSDVMSDEFRWVSRFVIDPVRHNEYYLFFGTDHLDGLKVMKAAYWKIDPVGGSGYQQDPLSAAGQGTLFGPAGAPGPAAADASLAELLRERFGLREFSINEAEEFALTATRYRETHVRPALITMQDAGRLHVTHSTRRSEKHFPAGTRMRFVV
jgi:three-Cys-motif partner protein